MADGFKERYDEHMVGRNGADAISRICLVVALVLVLLSFWAVGVSPFLYVLVLTLGIAAAVYAVLRMNSRNVAARQAEVEAFMGLFKRSSEREKRTSERSERPRRSNRTQRREPDEDQRESKAEPQEDEPKPQQPAEKVTISCENCGQRLSVPAGKGNIRITCPKCQERFVAHT